MRDHSVSLPVWTAWLARGALLLVVASASQPVQGQDGPMLAGTMLTGTVTRASDNTPVAEAAVTVFPDRSTYALTGTATDAAGRYQLRGVAPGAYRVMVRATGFHAAEQRVTLEAGRLIRLDLALHSTTSGAEAVVATPSRWPEAVRYVSASADVVDAAARDRTVAISPVEMLRSVPGVRVAQTGLDRHHLSVRSGGDGLAAAPLVLVDGRPAVLPGSGAAVFSLMPAPSISLKRVEVVRGPSAVLYGPSASAGVVHFITKTPFDDPGTTVSMAGSPRPFLQGEARHAAVIGTTFGYEIAAYGTRGTDWPLRAGETRRPFGDPRGVRFDRPSAVLPNQRVTADSTQLLRNTAYWAAGIHGQASYRLSDQATVSARGGYTALTGQMLSEWGPLQADPLGYAFAQIRVETDGLRVQAGLNNTQTGTSYLYGTGRPVTNRDVAYDAQVRYRLDMPQWATRFTVGADGHWTRPRTDSTLMGRYEGRDALDRYGAYAAAHTALTSRLDVALGLRAGADNQTAAVWPAAQAAVVLDVAPAHTVRLRYGRAAALPHARQHFIDAAVRFQTLSAPYDLAYQARGGVEGFTFERYRNEGAATALIPDAQHFGQALSPAAIPLQPLYTTALRQIGATWADDPATQPEPIQQLSVVQRRLLVASLVDLAGAMDDGVRTAGTLGKPDHRGAYRAIDGPRDVLPLQRPITQTLEVGYHGTFGDRLDMAADVYVGTTKNAARLDVASPLVYAPQLAADLEPVLTPLITQAATAPNTPLSDVLDAMGVTPAEAAPLIAGLVGQAYEATPVGVVQPDQTLQAARTSSMSEAALLAYRTVRRLRHLGADVRARVTAGRGIQVKAGLSVVHSDPSTLEGADIVLPTTQVDGHVGVDWALSATWSMHAAAHYASGAPMQAGLYVGSVDAAYPLDVGLRYDAEQHVPGLTVHLAAQNVLGQRRRAVVGAPPVGRMIWARMTYAL